MFVCMFNFCIHRLLGCQYILCCILPLLSDIYSLVLKSCIAEAERNHYCLNAQHQHHLCHSPIQRSGQLCKKSMRKSCTASVKCRICHCQGGLNGLMIFTRRVVQTMMVWKRFREGRAKEPGDREYVVKIVTTNRCYFLEWRFAVLMRGSCQ